jgi:hypothetical protein
MRGSTQSITIDSMLLHPDIHLEIARRRHDDLFARAEHRRLANASRLASYMEADRRGIRERWRAIGYRLLPISTGSESSSR